LGGRKLSEKKKIKTRRSCSKERGAGFNRRVACGPSRDQLGCIHNGITEKRGLSMNVGIITWRRKVVEKEG